MKEIREVREVGISEVLVRGGRKSASATPLVRNPSRVDAELGDRASTDPDGRPRTSNVGLVRDELPECATGDQEERRDRSQGSFGLDPEFSRCYRSGNCTGNCAVIALGIVPRRREG